MLDQRLRGASLQLIVLVATLGLALATVTPPVGAATDPDLALFNPNNGEWHLRYGNGAVETFFYGIPGDTPLMGDWDCDGIDTVAMYRESSGFIYYRNSNDFGVADGEFFFGIPGDIPIAGDWDNDGCDTFGIFRNGKIFLRNALSTGVADKEFWFGVPGDRPFAGDFTGDGVDTIGLYRQTTGLAYFTETIPAGDIATTDNQFFYGIPSDRILTGDWDMDDDDSVGIFRPTDQAFYLSFENQQGVADRVIEFGQSHWLPAAGDFGPPPPCGPFTGYTLSGSGNDVVSVLPSGSHPAALDISYTGGSNFVIWSQDAAFSNVDLLVNEIGAYAGSRPINHTSGSDGVQWLEITSSGPWTIQVKPFCELRTMTGDSIAGTGDDVVRANRDGAAALMHDGSSNFSIWSYQGTDRLDLEVNEIGTYAGTVLVDFGTEILEVTADGNWLVSFVVPRAMVGNSISGSGDEVVTVNRSGPALITHNGSSNFVVWSWQGETRLDLEVNEIGAFSGTVTIDPGTQFLEINADGNWSVTYQ